MNLSEASKSKIITLTTDFGYRDPFVGQMKGVILSIVPDAKIVDITHEVESHRIEDGAFILYQSYKYFPEGTVHIVVVDPGVGSERRALAVEARGHFFLCPDNGILSYILSQSSFRAFKIENKNYILKPNSPTFQGRDIFASAAAWLLRGVPINELGEEIRDPITFKVEEPVEIRDGGERKIIGKIIYIDKFGNCTSNIQVENLKIKRVFLRGLEIPLVRFYSEAKEGLSALVNSDGLLELFLYMGNASKEFGIERNQTVEVISDG